jgi:hypothetical protein
MSFAEILSIAAIAGLPYAVSNLDKFIILSAFSAKRGFNRRPGA